MTNKFYFYIINVLIIAVPLAFFEIIVEKKAGWGSGWKKDKWYAKPFAPQSKLVKFVTKIMLVEPPLNYHALVFWFIIPSIIVLEYFYVQKNIPLLLAVFPAVLVVEDFSWFLFNWNFDSLRQLFKGPQGTIFWHKRWIKISKNKYLPASYFSTAIFSLLLLLLF